MRERYTISTFVILSLFAFDVQGQTTFTNRAALLEDSTGFYSGIAVAIADMDADGLDDIVRLNQGTALSIEYQTENGQPFAHYSFGQTSNEEAWSIAIGDVNNDGYCDILTGGFYDGVRVLTAKDSARAYQPSILPGAQIFIQGSNFADINNDGHIDVFACHDDGASRIWGNNGAGGFVQANNWINFATVPASDNSGNYGSVWTDFDNDGDLDLYIAKCRQGVDNPNDPRRINTLYVNDGQNHFAEAAAEHGLKIKWQSWTADFQDIDNDGDMDCFVTNHDYPLQLLENDGAGHFTDIAGQAGVTGEGGFLQGIMRDFDNDGFVDILTAEPTFLYHNNGYSPQGGVTFTQMPNSFGGDDIGTLAVGDLNHDGFPDVYAAYACNINNPCNIADKLWMNNGNGAGPLNHFLAVNLVGNQSNRMGIGARIEIHGSWGIQVREVRSGESYGIMNSLTQHFGLGQEVEVGYLVVRWPSGLVDVLKKPAADQFLTIEEGSTCSNGNFELELSGGPIFCPGDSLTMSAPDGFDYLWNNGAAGRSLTVAQPGNFSVVAVDTAGCTLVSQVVKATYRQDETPRIAAVGETTFCQGDSLLITSSEASAYLWSNGDTTQSIAAIASGEYFVTVAGYCGEHVSEAISVEVLPAPPPQTNDLSVYDTDTATVIALGNDPHWYGSPLGLEPIAVNDTLTVFGLESDTVFYVEDVYTYGGGGFSAGMPMHQGSLYSGNQYNGELVFNVFEALTLKKVTVYTNLPGQRVIELTDAANEILGSIAVDIPEGESELELGFHIQPGTNYKLGTDEANNQQVFGFASPRLRRSDAGVHYPYTVPGVISITGSSIGSAFYYYFYRWQIEVDEATCTSERVPVHISVQPNAVEDNELVGKLSLFPNPSNGLFTLGVLPLSSGTANLTITDLTGRRVYFDDFEMVAGAQQWHALDLGEATPGLYFLQLKTGGHIRWMKLVVN